MIGKSEKGTKIIGRESLGRYCDDIINVGVRAVVSALTMGQASTLEARVIRTLVRWYLGPVHPRDGPYESLGRQSAAPISKGQAPIQEDLALPHNCEVRESRWVHLQPTVPTRHIHLEQHDTLARILFSNLDDTLDDSS